MKISMSDVEILSKIPNLPSSLPVYKTKIAGFNERKKAIDFFSKILEMPDLCSVEVENSIHLLGKKGQIQYYRPSGSLWARNVSIDHNFKDERRNWKTEKVKQEDGMSFELVLTKTEETKLVTATRKIFNEAELLGDDAFFADINLEQITQCDEKGREIGRFSGEATVRYLYKLNDIIVDGGGAKSYAYFYPSGDENLLVGIYHSWREPFDSQSVKLLEIEKAIERAISNDPELILYYKKKYRIQLREINVAYYSLPPFVFQQFIFPVIKIGGSVISNSKRGKNIGFEFARYYHVVHPKEYANSEIFAHYLVSRI